MAKLKHLKISSHPFIHSCVYLVYNIVVSITREMTLSGRMLVTPDTMLMVVVVVVVGVVMMVT